MVSNRSPVVSRPAPTESCRPAFTLTSIRCKAETKPTFPSSPLPFPALSISPAPSLRLLLPQPTSSAVPHLFPLWRPGFLIDGSPSAALSVPFLNHRSTTKSSFAFALHVDSSPPTTIRLPSTSVSSAPAPRCSPTQPLATLTTRSSHPCQFPIGPNSSAPLASVHCSRLAR
jgi:hypothetical protein